MKLKFYLRGLGIGILVTWLVMGVSNHKDVEAAKAETRAEVRALYEQESADGLFGDNSSGEEQSGVEEQTSSEAVIIRDEEQTQPPADMTETMAEAATEATSETETVPNGENADNAENADSADEADGQGGNVIIVGGDEDNADNADSEENGNDDMAQEQESITIVVSKGDDSGTVSRKLYNAGIIDSASEYDAYLMQHGYDKKINTGTKIIYEGDSWQTIAEKLTQSSDQ